MDVSSPISDSRLKALQHYQILDTPAEQEYDDLTSLASTLCAVPIALVSLIDTSRQWFKSCIGLAVRETPVELAFCAHAIRNPAEILMIPDATADPRFAQNALVTGEPYIRFYAGAPLVTPEGEALGTLCVIDRVPRTLTALQQKSLRALARQVVALLELRLQIRQHREIEQLFTSAVEVMQKGFILQQESGEVTYYNPQARQILGLTPEQLAGASPLPPGWAAFDEDGTPITPIRELTRKNTVLEVRQPGGELGWAILRSSPLYAPDAREPYATVATLNDITERKHFEERLQQAHEKTRQAHEWTQTILESITDAFLVLDREWRFVSLNQEAERQMGRSRAELIGKNVWHEYPDVIPTLWYEEYHRAVRDNTAVAFEVFTERSQRWCEVRAYPSSEGLSVYFRDITDRKDIEKTLRQSEARLEEAQSLARLGSFEFCATTGTLLWSRHIYALFDRDPALGPPTYEEALARFHPDDLSNMLSVGAQALKEGRPYECDLRIRQHDGSYRWVHSKAQHVVDARGIVQGIRGTLIDIHERKQAEEQTQASEENLKRAQSLAHVGSWELNLVTQKGSWSEEMYRLYGLPHPGPNSEPPTFLESLDCVHPEDRDNVLRHVSTGSDDELEYRLVLPDGRLRYVHALSQVMRDEAGVPTMLRGTLMDITERRLAEARIQEQMELLNQANARLEALATTDGLTGLKNHRTFQEKLTEEFARARRYGSPVSILLLDVDHFKEFNDRFGHPAGDLILKQLSLALQNQCRTSDLVARYGGEEFALILPETDYQGALEFAERVRTRVASQPWEKRAITVSVGVATLQAATPDEASLFDEADRALYRAKAMGRNCVAALRSG